MKIYEEELVTTNLGRKFWIYKNDSFYQQRVAGVGPYQAINLKTLRTLCPNARTVIDVGMNIAMNTIEYATWAKTVHGFEPTPQTYNMAIRNIEIAKKQQEFIKGWWLDDEDLSVKADIYTYPVGLGPQEAQTEIIIRPNNAGHNHVNNTDRPRWTGKKWITRKAKHQKVDYEKVPIEIKTLDSYHFSDVDIIKIDVEGFEYDVLLGAQQTIETWKPVVQVEMVYSQPHRFGYTVHDIIEYFKVRGYSMMLCDGTILPMEWQEVKGKMDRFFVHTDKIVQ